MDNDIEAKIDRLMLARRAAVRQMLIESGRQDILDEFDRNMRDCDTGVIGARATWAALSAAQRRVITMLADFGGYLIRSSQTRYYLMAADGTANFCGLPTARNLVARSLLECDGGALDPELRLNITERGRFVRKFGTSQATLPDPSFP